MQLEHLQGDPGRRPLQSQEDCHSQLNEVPMDLRSLQKPLKEQYRNDPNASQITLRAKGEQTDVPISCSVDIGRAIYNAEAHKGVGGAGAGACSGDLLLGALAACAQITCQMVAAAMAIPTERIAVTVDGDVAFRQHSGGHTAGPNWPAFLTFASRYISVKRTVAAACSAAISSGTANCP